MKLESLTILIPAYNDSSTIRRVVEEAQDVGSRVSRRLEILVIDDASRDDTYAILQKLQKQHKNITVLHHEENQGYGSTIKELYLKGKAEWLFTIPGDYQIGAKELEKLAPYTDRADCIIGWRSHRHDPSNRIFQSALYNGLVRLLFGITIHDINSVRLMRKKIISSGRLESNSAFVDAELTIRAQKKGFTIMEIPISHRPRAGSVGGGGKWWTILPTITEMIRFWFRIQFRG